MGKTALVLLDLQVGIMGFFPDEAADYLARVSQTIDAARAAGVSIIYVSTFFRPGHPEIATNNPSFERVRAMGGFVAGDASVAIAPAVAPHDGDVLVTKKRVSAFAGSDLDVVLRGLGADSLVLAGIATSGAVLSTVRQAADLDFNLAVLRDLCLDREDEVHRVLFDKVISKQAAVLDGGEWVKQLGAGAPGA